jgi:hypothetical protein
VQAPAGVLLGGLPGLGLAVDQPPTPHDPRDVLGRAGLPHREQALFRRRRGDARQLSDLGVGKLAVGQGLGQARQRAECPGHAHVLAGRTGREPHPPGQPGRAGDEAVAPPAAGVELAYEIEEAPGGGGEMCGQLGDLIAQPAQLRERFDGKRLDSGMRARRLGSRPRRGGWASPCSVITAPAPRRR